MYVAVDPDAANYRSECSNQRINGGSVSLLYGGLLVIRDSYFGVSFKPPFVNKCAVKDVPVGSLFRGGRQRNGRKKLRKR